LAGYGNGWLPPGRYHIKLTERGDNHVPTMED